MIRRVAAQARVELLLTLRRGESVLVVAGIPVSLLVFFAVVDVLPHGRDRAIDFLAPGILALAVISSAMTSLGIATGFERQAGVLRRLGTTPLGRSGLLLAKLVALCAVIAVQIAVIAGVALALGWEPTVSFAWVSAIMILGVVAFAAIGFTLAGRLRAETNLAAANGLFLLFLLAGGIVVPVTRLPDGLASIARLLPAEPLATGLRVALADGAGHTRSLVLLAAWAALASFAAVASFRWDG